MKMPIPSDWDSSTFCNFLVRWPNSDSWRIILRGLVSNPALEAFWDERTGDVTSVLAAFYPTLDQNLDELECTNMSIPVGTIWLFAGSDAPEDWLICQGDYYLETDFPELFATIGRLYGGSSGEGTFRLPDLRGRIPVGYGIGQSGFDPLGTVGGETHHTLDVSELPSHNHAQDSHNHTQDSHNHTQNSHNHTQDGHNHTQDGHNHTQNSHTHAFANPVYTQAAVVKVVLGGTGTDIGTATTPATTATNQAATATNQAATATNQAATATNQAATATNQAVAAANQAAGGGGAHNNLQPYQVLNYIIRAVP